MTSKSTSRLTSTQITSTATSCTGVLCIGSKRSKPQDEGQDQRPAR